MPVPVVDSGVHTPSCNRNGAFRDTYSQNLATRLRRALREQNRFDPGLICGYVPLAEDRGPTVDRIAPTVIEHRDREVPTKR